MVAGNRSIVNREDDGHLVQVPTNLAEMVGGSKRLEELLVNQAVVYSINVEELSDPDVRSSLMRAMTFSLQYGFLPGKHLHLVPQETMVTPENRRTGEEAKYKKSYAVVVGVHAYLASFEEWKRRNWKLAWVQMNEMTSAETEAITKSRYWHVTHDVKDAGAVARFLDKEEAEFCERVSLPYEPQPHYGFWRNKAYEYRDGKGKTVWLPDTIPNQRAPMDVAMQRALKACLMVHVPLMPLGDMTMAQRVAQLEDSVAPEPEPTPIEQAPLANRDNVQYEDDGDILYAAPDPVRPIRRTTSRSVPYQSW